MLFRLHAYRFTFRARADVVFPPGKAGNVIRGALGLCFRQVACDPGCPDPGACPQADCSYARLFAPRRDEGPSGLADSPRPFVLRAGHLDDMRVAAGAAFAWDVHVFDLSAPVVQHFALAFSRLLEQGLGPGRGAVELMAIDAQGERIFEGGRFLTDAHPAPLALDLAPPCPPPVERIRVNFLTPTEIKAEGGLVAVPEFGALFPRLRDRLSNLSALYGPGAFALDYRGQNERAARVRLAAHRLSQHQVERFSTRTQQRHPLGGFTGTAEYAGAGLAEFLPYLRAGEYTGVGRQTVWGKGAFTVELPEEEHGGGAQT